MRLEHVLLVMILLAACVQEPAVTELGEVEITEYEGEKLGSINDFRENSIKGPQQVDIGSYSLMINGLVENPMSLSYQEVLNKPGYNKVVKLDCVEGWSVKALWTGVLLSDLLADVNVKNEANTVKFYAVDGYTTTLPLDYIIDNQILLAYRINNATLPAARGFPFQLVAESKWGYKWIKWVTRIELTDDPDEKGFWEQRGYNQEGDVGGPIFER